MEQNSSSDLQRTKSYLTEKTLLSTLGSARHMDKVANSHNSGLFNVHMLCTLVFPPHQPRTGQEITWQILWFCYLGRATRRYLLPLQTSQTYMGPLFSCVLWWSVVHESASTFTRLKLDMMLSTFLCRSNVRSTTQIEPMLITGNPIHKWPLEETCSKDEATL